MKNKLSILACVATALFALPAHAQLFTFDTASSYTSNFAENGASPTYTDALNHSTTNGIGGTSGRLDVAAISATPNADTTAVYNQASFDLTSNQPFTLSIFFLTPASGNVVGSIASQVGFLQNNNQAFLTGASQNYISVAALGVSNNTLKLQSRFAINGNQGAVIDSLNFTVVNDTWYKLTSTFTKSAVSGFDFSAKVENWGSNGTTNPGVSLATVAGNQNQTNLGTDATLWAGFRANDTTTSNIVALDNFEVVPEPSTYAMLLGGVGMLVLFRRRRSA